ncbi:hypothetical protein DSM104299_04092 [Baekduia alba]|uniref:MarR family winged helix-turn-helix transcriptional regulator n=1 Tax=Baekduia alba TaxID=2997333 RepID=UPI0023420497|nr:MarR family transcriptional regulator [Baekduia alba]WCB95349.1 hypothetical protein DSM104299_04092 [Baekduia alba]
MSTTPQPPPRLGYLLKHSYLRHAEQLSEALSPLGVDGRELAVLRVLDTDEPSSQAEAAKRLGLDRTTMVGLVDTLEARSLVARKPHAADRRRNVVALTRRGQRVLAEGTRIGDAVEDRFLSGLSATDARRLRSILGALLGDQPA